MPVLEINGWRRGLKKISLTVSLKDRLGIGLRKAKEYADKILDDEIVSFEIEDMELAELLAKELTEIGVIVKIAKD